jgi:hypothetical protein
MRITDLLQLDAFAGTPRPDSPLDRILPPNPEPPSRPTVPPPTCGTLPPAIPSPLQLLGKIGKIGR